MSPMAQDSPIDEFISDFPASMDSVKDKLLNQITSLEGFGFVTPGALLGSLTIERPPDFDVQRLCMTAQAQRAFDHTMNPDLRNRQLAALLHLSAGEIHLLVNRLNAIPQPLQATRTVDSEWHFGITERQRLRAGRDYFVLNASQFLSREPRIGGRVLLPDLTQRLGPAWDQGRRGTCTAFSTAALAHYLRGVGGERPSPQFLYHQCKMLDGLPNVSGTHLETAMRVLADRNISGYGYAWGVSDAGITNEASWPYVSHAIYGNEAHSPPPEACRPHLYQSGRWGNTRGEVIRTTAGTSSMVREIRCMIGSEKIPVVVGLDLFPSFNNPNARRTGRITLPFGNERSIGAHAMLVVGYDDDEGTFLVRNSWSTGWAYDNPWQMSGHALIPYAYFTRYSQRAYTMRFMDHVNRVNIPEARRLYNRKAIRSSSSPGTNEGKVTGRSIAAINRPPRQFWKTKSTRPRKRSILQRIFGR